MSGNKEIVTCADGRTFPLCYLQWAEKLEQQQGCDYDYAFEVIIQKSTLGNAMEYIRKHPKKGGIFGAFKNKKNAPRKYPKLGDDGVTISQPATREPTPSQSVATTNSSPERSGPKLTLMKHEDFEEKNSAVEAMVSDNAVVAKKTPRSYASAARTPKQSGPIVIVDDDHVEERIPVGPSVPVIVEASPERPSVATQRIVADKDMLAQRVKLASPEKVRDVVAESPAKPLPAPQPKSAKNTPKSAPQVPQIVVSEDMLAQARKSLTSADGKKSYAQALNTPNGEKQVPSPFKKVAEIEEKSLYSVGDKVEIQRSNGQWINALVLAVSEKFVTVEYGDGDQKFQKKLPFTSKNLAAFGTNLKPVEVKPVAPSPKKIVAPSPKKEVEEKVMVEEKALYAVGDKVEIQRSNGQWVEGSVLVVNGKLVTVEYADGNLKFQKKMPMKSAHLAVFGTNLQEAEPESEEEVVVEAPALGYGDSMLMGTEIDLDRPMDDEDEDDGFRVVKNKKGFASPKLRNLRPIESPRKEFMDTARSDLTESPTDHPKKRGHSKKNSMDTMRSSKSQDFKFSMRSNKVESVHRGSEFGQSTYSKNLLPDDRPTPDYAISDWVQIRCSDGHWYRAVVLDVGEKAVLVEYKKRNKKGKMEKYQKKLPVRSRLLRHADDEDVNSVHSAHSARSSQSKQVALKYLVGPEKDKKAEKKAMSKSVEVPNSKLSKKARNSSVENLSAKYKEKEMKRNNEEVLTDSNSGSGDSRHVEILRSDNIWYEGRIIKSGKQACIVEYIIEGKKYQKTMPLNSANLAPYGTNIFVAEVGDDVEYLTTKGEWVRAQICQVEDAYYVILYMERAELVEKKIVRCSPHLARFGEHTGLVSKKHMETASRRPVRA